MIKNRLITTIFWLLSLLVLGSVTFLLGERAGEQLVQDDGSPVCALGSKCENPEVKKNIKIAEPQAGVGIQNNFLVTGTARVFENQLVVRVVVDGQKAFEQPVYAYAPDTGQFGAYAVEVKLPSFTKKSEVIIEAFQYSAKDGSEIDKETRTVYGIASADLITVKAFFLNNKLDPEVKCNLVFPVERQIVKTQGVARAALEELFNGPSEKEAADGYSSSLNQGIIINSLAIAGGIAKLDLNSELNKNIGGSCRVTAIRSQIEQTLKQFSTIKEVVISVNGQIEGILEP